MKVITAEKILNRMKEITKSQHNAIDYMALQSYTIGLIDGVLTGNEREFSEGMIKQIREIVTAYHIAEYEFNSRVLN